MGELDSLLGEVLKSLVQKTGFILVCENWALLRLVKSFVLLIWDTGKNGDQEGETSGYSCSCPDWRSYKLCLRM